MNRILCYYENIILGHSDHILNIRNIESCVKMFDGQEVYGDYYQDSTRLLQVIYLLRAMSVFREGCLLARIPLSMVIYLS